MSSVLYCNGKSSFHSHLTEMSEYFNLPDFNPNLLDTATKKLRRFNEQEYTSYWQTVRKKRYFFYDDVFSCDFRLFSLVPKNRRE